MTMNKHLSLIFSLFPISCVVGQNITHATSMRPNIVYILADDLGIGDLGCYGQKILKTPNIDRLAMNGMRFTNHYAGSTVSAPSRCALLTGKDMGHAYIRGNKHLPDATSMGYDFPLASSENTVADLLKQCEYVTACVGKWGLGGPNSEGDPRKHGFDYFFGYLSQRKAHRYYPDFLWENDKQLMLKNQVYSPYLITEKALDFIDRNASKSFFLYFTPTLPHAELIVPKESLQEFDGKFDEVPFHGNRYAAQAKPRAAYAAMVSCLDHVVGKIVGKLKEKNILENTIIIFSSDNGVHQEGGHDPEYFNSNGIFRGIKRDLYEGGIHTPFIVQWENVIAKGQTSSHISAFWDFLPTVADIVGCDKPENCDGISFLPTLTGKGTQREHEYIYHETYEREGKQSIIKDGWKLVRLNMKHPQNIVEELYDMNKDPSEQKNLIEQYPKIADELRKLAISVHQFNPNFSW